MGTKSVSKSVDQRLLYNLPLTGQGTSILSTMKNVKREHKLPGPKTDGTVKKMCTGFETGHVEGCKE